MDPNPQPPMGKLYIDKLRSYDNLYIVNNLLTDKV